MKNKEEDYLDTLLNIVSDEKEEDSSNGKSSERQRTPENEFLKEFEEELNSDEDSDYLHEFEMELQFVKIRDDEKIAISMRLHLTRQIMREVYNRDEGLTRLEKALYRRMGMRHRLYMLCHHNFLHLRHQRCEHLVYARIRTLITDSPATLTMTPL